MSLLEEINKIDAIDTAEYKIEVMTRTPDLTLIKAYLPDALGSICPSFFAFYNDSIVVTGDYGGWVFDYVWRANKQPIPDSWHLYQKTTWENNKIAFQECYIKNDFRAAAKEFWNNWKEEVAPNEDKVGADFEEFFEELVNADECRLASIVDKWADVICHDCNIEMSYEDWESFYSIGRHIHPRLLLVIALLQKIKSMNIVGEAE